MRRAAGIQHTDASLPQLRYNFVPIAQIIECEPGSSIGMSAFVYAPTRACAYVIADVLKPRRRSLNADILGIVRTVEDVNKYTSAKLGKDVRGLARLNQRSLSGI